MIDEFALELDAFAECILKRKEPGPSGLQGLRDVAVMQSIYRAANDGRPAYIPAQDQEN